MAFGLRRAKVLGYLSVQLVSKISNLCGPDPPTSRTDRRTGVGLFVRAVSFQDFQPMWS